MYGIEKCSNFCFTVSQDTRVQSLYYIFILGLIEKPDTDLSCKFFEMPIWSLEILYAPCDRVNSTIDMCHTTND